MENTDEDIIISIRFTYIVTDHQLNITNISLHVIVTNDNILCTDIKLVEGDTRIFQLAKKDILKHLLKIHKKLVRGQEYVVYVNN
ncbi:MAG: Clas62 [Betabaculovirus sp.]|nr:MAG: Clas62 [Betabaculovirus sp.]